MVKTPKEESAAKSDELRDEAVVVWPYLTFINKALLDLIPLSSLVCFFLVAM